MTQNVNKHGQKETNTGAKAGQSATNQNKIPINLLIYKIKYDFLSTTIGFIGNFSNSTQHDLPTTIYTCILHIAYKQISTTNVTLQKRRETSKLRHMKFVTMPPKNMPSWHDIGGQG
ncbi:hypothetical protein HMPREF3216_00076 [Gardnerella vaginalis]|uniref:Uncharacterized protein n=1 Tax=Gardnerella vaginalis TaxID=2702 RepID=A0A133NSY7_GARVA|nr:hypothetical protein HMPREF3216_00076 [Gardnerella vaginalis]